MRGENSTSHQCNAGTTPEHDFGVHVYRRVKNILEFSQNEHKKRARMIAFVDGVHS